MINSTRSRRQADSTQRAIAVSVFPEAARGTADQCGKERVYFAVSTVGM